MTTKASKRILSVTITRIADYDADTSDLGTYSDTPEDNAIVAVGEHEGEFVDQLGCECGHSVEQHTETDDYAIGEGGIKCTVEGCDCEDLNLITIERGREYRYFNPSRNYEGESVEDIRKYTEQDYKRMRDLNRGEWGFIGIKANAQVQLANAHAIQTITSGGLWGIETDSGDSYFKEVEGEELSQLRDELHTIGFTMRAISAAFRNVQHKDG